MAALLLEMFRAMKDAAADCYDACRMQPGDFRWVVLGDYNRNTSLTYSKLLGFSPQRTFLQNVGRLGHIPFDPLINLADLAAGAGVKAKDAVLLFLCGPVSCGAMAVTAC
jgi:3-oxoacyl-[acyl-carrier-protein] synthase III